MRVNRTICWIVLPLLGVAPAACPAGTILEMTIPRDAIDTPGDARLDFLMTPAARFAGPYHLRILASVARDVVHERTMTLMKEDKVSCELSFPEVRTATEVRCRAELFLGEEFLEACEKPIRLWPHHRPRVVTQGPTDFWVFDPSGALQNLLPEFGVAAVNAVFQAVRDFGTPRVVFVGERLDPAHSRMILERVRMTDENTIVVLLRQEQFPKDLQISTAQDKDVCDNVVWDRAHVLLEGLAARDLLGLLQGGAAAHIQKTPGRSVTTCITGTTRTDEEVCSYLGVMQEENHLILYCQLPSTDRQDPRQMVLLHNLIQFACARIHPALPHEAIDTERGKP